MYCKLFTSLYQGTLRGRSDEILVFTNLLAHCDKDGFVDKHWRAISQEVGIDEERVKAALLALEAEDAESRSVEEKGRRLLRIDEHRAWGWRVTNYSKYREIKNEDDRREQNRLSQDRWRNKHKKGEEISTRKQSVSDVITDNQDKPMQMQYADAKVDADETPKPPTERDALRHRLGGFFRRKPETPWSEKELRAFGKLKPQDGDVDLLAWFFAQQVPERGHGQLQPLHTRRRDLATLLNNWPGEVDKARQQKRFVSVTAPRPTGTPPIEPPPASERVKQLQSLVLPNRGLLNQHAVRELAGQLTQEEWSSLDGVTEREVRAVLREVAT